MQICVIIFYGIIFIIINKRSIQFCLLFLDLHLQIFLPKVTLFSCCFWLSLICLFHFTKRWVLISILFIICCFFLSPLPLSLSLFFSLSPSLSLSFSHSLSLLWIIGVISQSYLSVFLSLLLFLSRKVPLLLHLMQIYERFCPCFTLD